jgi:O-antigen/teichoic acid export membrane protein
MFQPFTRYYHTHKARIHRLSAEGGWIVVGQVASVIGALVLVRVLTEYLDPVQYGQLALGLTLAGLVNQTVLGGITAGIGRYYSIAAERQDLGGYLLASRYLLAYATAGVLAISLMLMAGLYWLGYSQWIGLAVAALVFSVLSGYNGALSGIQNAARQRAVVAFHSGLDAWLKILLAVGAVLWLGTSSTAIVVGYACSSLLVTISQLFFLRRKIPEQHAPIPNRQHWVQQIWTYSFPITTFGAFTWLQLASDRWALQAFATSSDVGQYAVLFQLGYTPIALITGMAMSFMGPILYQRSGDAADSVRNADVHRLGWRLSQICVMASLLGFAMAFGLHEQLFALLVASDYRGSSYLLPWVVLAGGLFAAGQMLALKLMSEMKPSDMTKAKIVTASIGTLLNVIGAGLAGMQGVVWAMLVFSGIYLIWMAVLASRLPSLSLNSSL